MRSGGRRARGLVLVGVAALLACAVPPGIGPATAARVTVDLSPHQVSTSTAGYDIVTSAGKVTSYGAARFYGDASSLRLSSPIAAMAVMPDGRGYWLVTRAGTVYRYGAAASYGPSSPQPGIGPGGAVVGIVSSGDGLGYWLCGANGTMTAFGDAPHLPSLARGKSTLPIVGCAVLRDEKGAWVVNSAGEVFPLGAAPVYGSLSSNGADPVVGIARTHDGRGYWVANSAAEVTPFGDAASTTTVSGATGEIAAIASQPSGSGYWEVTTTGKVLAEGAPALGSLASPTSPVVDIAPASAPPAAGPYPAGAVGYDVNWPQCAGTGSSAVGPLPGPPSNTAGSGRFTVAVVGVDGWAVDDYNSCLSAEVNWAATTATEPNSTRIAPYELYMFINSPASSSTIDGTGPRGKCSQLSGTAKEDCLAYNYGYNSAVDAVAYATKEGAASNRWWLDVENDSCAPGEWNDAANGEFWSCNQSLDALTIQGALDALRADKLIAGVYCTRLQWDAITGSYVPKGGTLPIWVAGAPWTSPPYPSSSHYPAESAVDPWCSGEYNFAHGSIQMVQETPGSNGYPFDPDVAC